MHQSVGIKKVILRQSTTMSNEKNNISMFFPRIYDPKFLGPISGARHAIHILWNTLQVQLERG